MALKQLTNSDLAELLALKADEIKFPLAGKAFRRASRRAFSWEVEAFALLENGRSLTELEGVGPYIEKQLTAWFENLPAIPEKPPNRRDFLTKTEARLILSQNQQWQRQYRGDLQMHTVWSDGSGSIKEMAEAAVERGYSYIGITDHSKGLKIANGIDEERLFRQCGEIDRVNAELKGQGINFQVLKSLEMNLNPQGKGDMHTTALRGLDLVVGSFHSALRKKEDQTERYLAALDNPNVHILGHPRGRIYNFRSGLSADWKTVFARAAALGKAVEIDSFPDRQDLNVELLLLAKQARCLIAIDTDAHHPWQLEFAQYGLAAALKAGMDSKKIINFLEASELKTLFKGRHD
jgi:histidinol phosphatase-like PHP family hydrolase